MLKEVTKNDKILSYYKFDRKNNYKTNLCNSLGAFEHPESLAIVHNLLTTLAFIQTQKNSKD